MNVAGPIPSPIKPIPDDDRRNQMFEYRVITERDKVFSGAFDPEALERVLNEHAHEGWRLAEGFMAASVWKSAKAEILLILERPVSLP